MYEKSIINNIEDIISDMEEEEDLSNDYVKERLKNVVNKYNQAKKHFEF